ncbi:MAG: MFS transporter [Euryarchaeota archaeon]|nr:MFS transporter [Euryarchaeota archaeon]
MLDKDGKLLFLTRGVRLFAYGFLSIVLVLYLEELGLSDLEVGALLALTLIGDTAISLYITTKADRTGRRIMLVIGAILMLFAGVVFVLTDNFAVLLVAAIIGVISPSGNEVGPFLSIEQSSLSQIVASKDRTRVFAYYNLLGSIATGLGAISGGWIAQIARSSGSSTLDSYRSVVLGYALFGIVLLLLFLQLSTKIEVPKAKVSRMRDRFGLHRSRKVVTKLSLLFSMDAFGGGFIVQSVMAYWFFLRFGTEPAMLGTIFFAANILAGFSALSAVWIAKRIGLIRTMVYTHLPSNVLLILIPLMPSFELALTLLLLRFSISQMDVPTRQSYVIAVVDEDERSAASGITGVARTFGQSGALMLTGFLLKDDAMLAYSFFIAGLVKITYDLLLYRSFRSIRPEEELS